MALNSHLKPEEVRRRLDDILPYVEKPGRYFAGEIGLDRKEWGDARARVAMAFPDVYEIAVANIGHRLIQHIINSRESMLAERVYAPWPDMEKRMRETGTPLYSLESFHAIAHFDIFGVSLTHELSYTNLLMLIDLAGLELRAEDRGFPIVLAGGPSVFNPEPVAEFVDAFVLGDGEEVSVELVEDISRHREEIDRARGDVEAEKALKKRILDRWGGADGGEAIQGVYVPSHFRVSYQADGRIAGIENTRGGPKVVKKAVVKELDSQPWILDLPLSHMQGIADRVTVEPARGCTHGCRFCQAGMIYRPFRMRSLDGLVEQAEHLLESTGRQELSFLALSVTDWPPLREFIGRMQAPRRDYHLRISLPSGRIAALSSELTELLMPSRKGGLTLAIEAATERLRAVINKDASDEDIERAVTNAILSGWNLIKLYFMIGLPTETDEDVHAIVELVGRIVGIGRKLKKEHAEKVGRLRLTVSVSSFVPKSHTPFQWAAMDSPEELDRKQRMLLDLRRIKNVEYNSHDVEASELEGVLARGDRRLSGAIERAFRGGARFDAWGDMLDAEVWRKAVEEEGLDRAFYLRARELGEALPWDHLSCGVSKEWLKKEWGAATEGRETEDCNEGSCTGCGLVEIVAGCGKMRRGMEI